MKAQNYQIKRDNLVIYGLLAGLLIPVLATLLDEDISSMTGSDYMAASGMALPIALMVISLVLTSRICGWDSVDKTINYEIMAGHSRRQVYFGRVCVSLLWTLAAGLVIMSVPLLLICAVSGWGNSMSFGDAVLRIVLALFPLLRLSCEFMLLTVLVSNCYIGLVLGYVLYAVSMLADMIYGEFADKALTVQLASSNWMSLFDFSNYSLEYIEGEDVMVFSTSLEPSMLIGTIAVSLITGAVCIAAGYAVFCRRDMR